jgi:hypothetical protein
MSRLKSVLSHRLIDIILTLISIMAINCWQLILPGFDYDNSYSIAAAKSLSEGHNYTIKMASPEDLSKSFYQPVNQFPPGYSLLLVLIHIVFSTTWIVSFYILNAFGLTGLVLLFRKLLFQLDLPAWILHITVLYFGFSNHAFHDSNNTDLFALFFYLLGLCLLLDCVKSGKMPVLKIALAAVALGFTAFLKYLYIPLSILPFISLFVYGYLGKQKFIQTAAIRGFVMIILMLSCLLLFLFFISGSVVYINPSATGFYPHQLLWLAPVVPSSYLNLVFINVQLGNLTHVSFPKMMEIWSVINVLCLISLIYCAWRFYRVGKFDAKNFKTFYAIHAVIFSIVLFGLLSALTVFKNAHYASIFRLWVYNMEMRYYAVFSVLIVQFTVFLTMHLNKSKKSNLKVIFYVLVISIFVEEVVHGSYYCLKQLVVMKEYGSNQLNNRIYFRVMEMAKSETVGRGDVIFCSNSRDFANLCSLSGVPLFYDIGNLKSSLPCSKPVKLIILVNTKSPGYSVPLLNNSMIKPDSVFKKNIFYFIVDIPKSSPN